MNADARTRRLGAGLGDNVPSAGPSAEEGPTPTAVPPESRRASRRVSRAEIARRLVQRRWTWYSDFRGGDVAARTRRREGSASRWADAEVLKPNENVTCAERAVAKRTIVHVDGAREPFCPRVQCA